MCLHTRRGIQRVGEGMWHNQRWLFWEKGQCASHHLFPARGRQGITHRLASISIELHLVNHLSIVRQLFGAGITGWGQWQQYQSLNLFLSLITT
jgi:hypothetical protein